MDSSKYKLPSGRAEIDLHDGSEVKHPQNKTEIIDTLREALTELNELKNEKVDLLAALKDASLHIQVPTDGPDMQAADDAYRRALEVIEECERSLARYERCTI